MKMIEIGGTVPVKFNGHLYSGVVLALSKTRALVRFTTGSGRTRDTWFRQSDLFALQEARKPEVAPVPLVAADRGRDNRYDHAHPRHHELMLPCYPKCQEAKS